MTTERLHSASQVASRLDVKAGMVRRYHLAFEKVTREPLPRDPIHNGRLVDDVQLEVLVQARELVKANPSLSVEDAIKSLLGFATVPTAPVTPQKDLLEAILRELQEHRKETAENRRELAELREQNTSLLKQVKALPSHSPGIEGPLEDRIESLKLEIGKLTRQIEAPKPHRVSVIAIDPRRDELERQNQKLKSELEQVRAEQQTSRRAWWRLWSKR